MTKFEFEKSMEQFGQSKTYFYSINYIRLHHDGMNSIIVEGKIPLDLAELIYDKYDNRKYGIRTDNEYDKPTKDVYKYYIDTVEGLTAFLLEVTHKVYGMQSTDSKLKYSLDEIDLRMLKSVNTNLSTLMKKIDNKPSKSYFDYKVRKKIIEFDEGINPYNNLDKEEYDNSFSVRGFNENHFSLIDKEDNIEFRTIRYNGGFKNMIIIRDEDPYRTICIHSYDEKGEKVIFDQYTEYGMIKCEYNITNNTFVNHLGKMNEARDEDKEYIMNILDSFQDVMRLLKEKNIKPKNNLVKKLNK